MNILQLKEQHPKQFETEHMLYLEHGLDYDWWEHIYDNFREDCADAYDLQVAEITFSGFDAQGDGAAFEGCMPLSKYMSVNNLDVKYPALYIHAKELKLEIQSVMSRRSCYIKGVDTDDWDVQSWPSGVFALLDADVWDEMVSADLRDGNFEEETTKFLRGLADDLYKQLDREHEYWNSEEAFIESAERNEINYEVSV
jgi:hypothetical protein